MEGLDGGFLDRTVHALGLPVGPRVIRLGEPMVDVVLSAHAFEDMPAHAISHAATVARLLGERVLVAVEKRGFLAVTTRFSAASRHDCLHRAAFWSIRMVFAAP